MEMIGMPDESFLEILITDVARSMERHESSGTQSNKRDLVRTTFAAIEGATWVFREHVMQAAQDTYGLEPDEIIVLSETTYQVTERGIIRPQQKFIPLVNTIKLIARIATRIAPSKRIDFSGPGWNLVGKAIDIRNRITHPKDNDDLTLTNSDTESSIGALFWLLQETSEVMEATNLASIDYLGELRHVLGKLKVADPQMLALYNSVQAKMDGD